MKYFQVETLLLTFQVLLHCMCGCSLVLACCQQGVFVMPTWAKLSKNSNSHY